MSNTRLLLICLAVLVATGCTKANDDVDSAVVKQEPLEVVALNALPQVADGDKFDDFEWGIETPSIPDTANVYRVATPKIDAEMVRSIGRELGITDEILKIEDKYTVGDDSDKQLEASVTGNLVRLNVKAPENSVPLQDVLPLNQYKDRAVEWMKRLNQWSDTKKHYESKQKTVWEYKDGGGTRHIYSTRVSFRYGEKDGLPITGYDSGYAVIFGESGRVIGVSSSWKEVGELVGEYPLISVSEALDNIRDGDEVQIIDARSGQNATVDSVELVYYSDQSGYRQEVFAPYYKFQGSRSDGGRFSALALALREDDYRRTGI